VSSVKVMFSQPQFLVMRQPNEVAVAQATHFHSEQEAQQHCPNDTIVWVNTKTGVYHLKGERWYGATKEGVYECRREADAEGDRVTRNGR
jgi:hypothetical protein